jgi:hypothetical protein
MEATTVQSEEMVPLCLDQGVAVLPYSPLARGLLAGSSGTPRSASDSLRDQPRRADREVVARVAELASECGVAPAQIALGDPHRVMPPKALGSRDWKSCTPTQLGRRSMLAIRVPGRSICSMYAAAAVSPR